MKKWMLSDWGFFILTIVSPVASLVCSLCIESEKYSDDEKIATIVAGITIPIVLIGWKQNENKGLVKSTQKAIDELEQSISATSDMARILSSNDDKKISFARRRLIELDDILKITANESETKLLPVTVYYCELNNMADIIEIDGNTAKCEIWAMTGFSDEEWGDKVNDFESEWGKRIKKLSEKYITNRICLIDQELAQLLKKDKGYYLNQKQDWIANSSNSFLIQQKRLKSFFDYLTAYYTPQTKSNKHKVTNFALKDTSQAYSELVQAKGFFGIKLSDDSKYVIKGEDVSPATGLQGQFVFYEDSIRKLYDIHKKACKNNKKLEDFLQSEETSQGFKDFISENGIVFNIKKGNRKRENK